MRIALILLMVAVANTGCFVFEEIEAGRKIMAAHSPEGPESTGSDAESAEAAQTPRERLGKYYAEQRAKAKSAAAKVSKSSDPVDAIGSCRVRGSTHFMRRSDCELRGGTFL